MVSRLLWCLLSCRLSRFHYKPLVPKSSFGGRSWVSSCCLCAFRHGPGRTLWQRTAPAVRTVQRQCPGLRDGEDPDDGGIARTQTHILHTRDNRDGQVGQVRPSRRVVVLLSRDARFLSTFGLLCACTTGNYYFGLILNTAFVPLISSCRWVLLWMNQNLRFLFVKWNPTERLVSTQEVPGPFTNDESTCPTVCLWELK